MRTQNVSEQNQKHFLCPGHNLSATNVARAGERGNICVGNNVSVTMCPRLPGTLLDRDTELTRAVDVMMARAKRIYVLMIKVKKLFPFFRPDVSPCLYLRTFAPKSSHAQIFSKLSLQVENDKIRLKT